MTESGTSPCFEAVSFLLAAPAGVAAAGSLGFEVGGAAFTACGTLPQLDASNEASMAIKRSAATELSFMGNFVSQNPKRSGHEICHCEMTGFQGVKSSAAGSRNVDFSGVTQGHCSLSDEPVHLSVVGRLEGFIQSRKGAWREKVPKPVAPRCR